MSLASGTQLVTHRHLFVPIRPLICYVNDKLDVYQTAAGNGYHALDGGIKAVSWSLCEGSHGLGLQRRKAEGKRASGRGSPQTGS